MKIALKRCVFYMLFLGTWFPATAQQPKMAPASEFIGNEINTLFEKYNGLHHFIPGKYDSLLFPRLRSKLRYPGTHLLSKGLNVFGFHTYWMGDAYESYNFSLLTHVAYFGAEFNPSSGAFTTLRGWDTTHLVEYAKKENPTCKILLTIFCYGKSIDTLLNNVSAQSNLIENIVSEIIKRNGDGVCIDFEDISSGYAPKFAHFAAALKSQLALKGLQLTMTLPAIDYHKAFDCLTLAGSVDLFILMGYDYQGGTSEYASPIAPLTIHPPWISASVSASVDYYLQQHIPSLNLLLAVPYYGAIWETTSMTALSKITRFVGYRTYSYAASQSMLGSFIRDTSLRASYYSFEVKEKSDSIPYRQFWLDDSYSLGRKYDYILDHKLGGVGIWALGYDNGSTELWELLKTKFAGQPASIDSSAKINSPLLRTLLKQSENHAVLLGITAGSVLFILLLVFVQLLRNPMNVLQLKKKNIYIQVLVSTLLVAYVLLFCILFFCFRLSLLPAYSIAAGGIAGITLLYPFFSRSKKEMP